MNREDILNNLRPVLVNKDQVKNGYGAIMREVPHTDLVVVPVIVVPEGSNVILSGENVADLHMTRKEIIDRAMSNMESSGYVLKGLNSMVGMDESVGAPGILVLTNQDSMYGAAEVLNQNATREAAEIIGGDFYILPSSKHEVLLVPESFAGVDELSAMVREVNRQVVSDKDWLSDHVYHYSSVTNRVKDTAEERNPKIEVHEMKVSGGVKL